jgi:pimeloyl-ACP methyl ester carboxylesterase
VKKRNAALVACALLCGGCGVRALIYPAPPVRVPSPPPAPLVEVALPGRDGPAIAWLAESGAAAPLAIYFHGNGENLETLRWAGVFARFAAIGVDILAVDYPGYGRSAGAPSEQANMEAAVAAWDWARRERPRRRRIAAGWSLGAAVAVALAARHPDDTAGLIALSPWTSLSDVAAAHYPAWMVRSLLRERYDNLAAAPAVRCPSLVVHGAADAIIPAQHGREVAARLGPSARFVSVAGADHNDLLDREEVWRAIEAFVDPLRPVLPAG